MRVNIKPLSVNRAFQGRRFKTKEYRDYERNVLLLLPRCKVPDGRLQLRLEFGLSSKNADLDNPVKLFTDILQKRWGFNDRNIYRLEVEKVDVKKGKEYIEFELTEIK